MLCTHDTHAEIESTHSLHGLGPSLPPSFISLQFLLSETGYCCCNLWELSVSVLQKISLCQDMTSIVWDKSHWYCSRLSGENGNIHILCRMINIITAMCFYVNDIALTTTALCTWLPAYSSTTYLQLFKTWNSCVNAVVLTSVEFHLKNSCFQCELFN